MKNIAIVAGGDSGEYEISLRSAAVVKKYLDASKYNGYKIHMRNGEWTYQNDNGVASPVDKNDFSIIENGKKITFDGVFVAIHGTPGEDGKLQGYFDLLGLPYNCCSLLTSALTFNKHFCKQVVNELGVKTAKAVHIYKDNKLTADDILKEINLPCIVKPNNGGSSVATFKIEKKEELEQAIKTAFTEDAEVLIEEFITGTEITNGCITRNGEIFVLPITEVVSKKGFFDYEAKYTPGMSEEITPARISADMEKQVKETTIFLYKKLNCKGMVRIDYIIMNDIPYFLEVNTTPGLSEQSIIPQQARHIDISLTELFDIVIEEMLKK